MVANQMAWCGTVWTKRLTIAYIICVLLHSIDSRGFKPPAESADSLLDSPSTEEDRICEAQTPENSLNVALSAGCSSVCTAHTAIQKSNIFKLSSR